jgi:hypothetical protein
MERPIIGKKIKDFEFEAYIPTTGETHKHMLSDIQAKGK